MRLDNACDLALHSQLSLNDVSKHLECFTCLDVGQYPLSYV